MLFRSIAQIKEMCDKVIWLDHGTVMDIGEPEEICGKYEEFINKEAN